MVDKNTRGRLTERQEKFARLVVELDSQTDAYRQCYSWENMLEASVHRNAHKLAVQNTKVASRIDEIRSQLRQDTRTDLKWKIEKLQETRAAAHAAGQHTAAVRAIDVMSKLDGDQVARSESKTLHAHVFGRLGELTDDQLMALVAGGRSVPELPEGRG